MTTSWIYEAITLESIQRNDCRTLGNHSSPAINRNQNTVSDQFETESFAIKARVRFPSWLGQVTWFRY